MEQKQQRRFREQQRRKPLLPQSLAQGNSLVSTPPAPAPAKKRVRSKRKTAVVRKIDERRKIDLIAEAVLARLEGQLEREGDRAATGKPRTRRGDREREGRAATVRKRTNAKGGPRTRRESRDHPCRDRQEADQREGDRAATGKPCRDRQEADQREGRAATVRAATVRKRPSSWPDERKHGRK